MSDVDTLIAQRKLEESRVSELEKDVNKQLEQFDELVAAHSAKPSKFSLQVIFTHIIYAVMFFIGFLYRSGAIAPMLLVAAMIFFAYQIHEYHHYGDEMSLNEVVIQNEKLKISYFRYDKIYCSRVWAESNFILVPLDGIQIEYRENQIDTLVASSELAAYGELWRLISGEEDYSGKDRGVAKIVVPTQEDVLKWEIFLEKAKEGIRVRRVSPPELK